MFVILAVKYFYGPYSIYLSIAHYHRDSGDTISFGTVSVYTPFTKLLTTINITCSNQMSSAVVQNFGVLCNDAISLLAPLID